MIPFESSGSSTCYRSGCQAERGEPYEGSVACGGGHPPDWRLCYASRARRRRRRSSKYVRHVGTKGFASPRTRTCLRIGREPAENRWTSRFLLSASLSVPVNTYPDVYRQFACADHAVLTQPPTALVLAVATLLHRSVASPSAEEYLVPALTMPVGSRMQKSRSDPRSHLLRVQTMLTAKCATSCRSAVKKRT